MHLEEKTIKSETVYEGLIFNITHDTVLLENENTAFRDVLWHNGGVCVIPVTDDNEIYLVKQFRYPFDRLLLEIPAGKRDSFTEDFRNTAQRELEEETGMQCENLIPLGEYYSSPAILDEVIALYLATDLETGKQHTDDDEFLELVRVPFPELVKMVERNEIPDGKTQVAVMKAARILGV